ncbi:MAG: tRNA (adenosine(37)-N6)-threonylcarbamoyltransferase complex transferase subunit TsaD [Puniceicoccales bacterium]|nr:tRNA (adenosine(37)-N6)-threonylcarbamoyltransferase complex transferase subunit TsaD [Puniceicoccales bacterium]
MSCVLAIESSCDDAGLAVFSSETGLLHESTRSQLGLHRRYGGVVPGLAVREHLRSIPLLLEDLQKNGDRAYLQANGDVTPIDHLAVTTGPGLAASLAMGLQAAQALAAAWQKPLRGVHHLRGHLFSAWIPLFEREPASFFSRYPDFLPQLALLVSGGHTLLLELETHWELRVLAATVDDAAGEALDKGAKLLGLPYPGGPEIEKKALEGNPQAYDFPKAFTKAEDRKFSFSGLKTSLRYRLEKIPDEAFPSQLADLCASYQKAVVDTLCLKTRQVLLEKRFTSLALSGGVAANGLLQAEMAALAREFSIPLLRPHPRHTGDNAAMIAFAALVDPAHTQASPALEPYWKL